MITGNTAVISNEIILAEYECHAAAMVGVQRRLTYMFHHVSDHLTVRDLKTDLFNSDIHAAGAEMAFAKFIKCYWEFSVNTFKKPDVGSFQVRFNFLENGHLIVRPEDNPTEKYVLVIGCMPKYRIAGWCFGYEAKQDKFWRNPGNQPGKRFAYWVPQDQLKPLNRESIRNNP